MMAGAGGSTAAAVILSEATRKGDLTGHCDINAVAFCEAIARYRLPASPDKVATSIFSRAPTYVSDRAGVNNSQPAAIDVNASAADKCQMAAASALNRLVNIDFAQRGFRSLLFHHGRQRACHADGQEIGRDFDFRSRR